MLQLEHNSVADLHSKILDPTGQNLVIFMQLSAQFDQLINWRQPHRPPLPARQGNPRSGAVNRTKCERVLFLQLERRKDNYNNLLCN